MPLKSGALQGLSNWLFIGGANGRYYVLEVEFVLRYFIDLDN